jgi:DNA-binding response OmpR family regulator
LVILVAEDEGLIAFALEWALRLAGHQVLGPVDTVAGALGLVERKRPDLALIDLDLRHGDDGADLAHHLHEKFGTPVLFTSARIAHARKNRHVALGLIPKPYDTDQVLDVVSFVGDVASGVRPPRVPNQVELFQPIG